MNEKVVLDIDGNPYNTVKIGNQVWMAENLRSTHYRNGEKIVVSKNRRECEWHIRNESAVYFSQKDPTNYIKYGLLYTPFAMFDACNREITMHNIRQIGMVRNWEP